MTLRQLTDWDGQERDPSWSPNGDRLAFVWFPKDVERNTAQIHIIDVGSGKSEQIIDTFEGASLERTAVSDLTWSPDGKRLAFIGSRNSLSSAVYLVDVGTRKLDRITVEMVSLYGLTWSPDGSLLAFVGQGPRGVQEVFTIKSTGTDLKQITDHDDFGYGSSFAMTRGQRLTWSPDGKYLAFVRDGKEKQEQRIWIIRSDGSGSPEMVTSE
jgi:Tol biopolymer transport system component